MREGGGGMPARPALAVAEGTITTASPERSIGSHCTGAVEARRTATAYSAYRIDSRLRESGTADWRTRAGRACAPSDRRCGTRPSLSRPGDWTGAPDASLSRLFRGRPSGRSHRRVGPMAVLRNGPAISSAIPRSGPGVQPVSTEVRVRSQLGLGRQRAAAQLGGVPLGHPEHAQYREGHLVGQGRGVCARLGLQELEQP